MSTRRALLAALSAVAALAPSHGLSLKKVLRREYSSFFAPMERDFYAKDVQFLDPMISISGVDAYQSNVDLLAGRTALGGFLFRDASITLHNIEALGEDRLRTRWTLRVEAKFLPWAPVARFTGVSDYTLDGDGRVKTQTDYWDSINLVDSDGKETYGAVDKIEGLKDFVGQLLAQQDKQPGVASQELPYALLRRAKDYEVRRYPAIVAAETVYETRPEGFDRLGSFCGGSNAEKRRVKPFAPSLVLVPSDEAGDKKMRWPLSYGMPGQPPPRKDAPGGPPSPGEVMPSVALAEQKEMVVAVRRFTSAATANAVKYETQELRKAIRRNGLEAAGGSEDTYIFAQFDAIFSLGDRRNEVWVPLDAENPWAPAADVE